MQVKESVRMGDLGDGVVRTRFWRRGQWMIEERSELSWPVREENPAFRGEPGCKVSCSGYAALSLPGGTMALRSVYEKRRMPTFD